LQGAFESLDGRLHRGLVTLPMPILQAHATFQPHARPGMQVEPCDRSKAARAAAIVLARLGNTGGGKLILESRICAAPFCQVGAKPLRCLLPAHEAVACALYH
jgi:hypothetical protein